MGKARFLFLKPYLLESGGIDEKPILESIRWSVSVGIGTRCLLSTTETNCRVNNKLKTIEVISLLETERAYELVLRNVSNKRINGYSISLGNGASRTIDMSVGEKTVVARASSSKLRCHIRRHLAANHSLCGLR
jgi:hypothetical protein